MTDWREHRPTLHRKAGEIGANNHTILICTCGENLGLFVTTEGIAPVRLAMAQHRAEFDD